MSSLRDLPPRSGQTRLGQVQKNCCAPRPLKAMSLASVGLQLQHLWLRTLGRQMRQPSPDLAQVTTWTARCTDNQSVLRAQRTDHRSSHRPWPPHAAAICVQLSPPRLPGKPVPSSPGSCHGEQRLKLQFCAETFAKNRLA